MVDINREAELDQCLQLLHFAFRAVVARPDQMLAQRGLGRVHHRVLFFIRRNPGSSVNRLLGILGVSRQALNGPLRELLAQGLIRATASAEDRRSKRLELTAQGTKFEAALSGDQRERFAAAFARLGRNKELAWREAMELLAQPLGSG